MNRLLKCALNLLWLPAAISACGVSSRSGTKSANLTSNVQSPLMLSDSFLTNCAPCHGKLGKGLAGPDISPYDVAAVERAVRSGFIQAMPAFSEIQYPTTTLKADVAAIASGRAVARDLPQASTRAPLRVGNSAEQMASAIRYTLGTPVDGNDPASQKSKAKLGLFGIEPFVMPYVKCMDLPDKNDPEKKSHHCVNVVISGSTDEGYEFADFGICKDIRTQRPYNPLRKVKKIVDSPTDPRLKDSKFMADLDWVNSQIRASGCICCHDSKVDKNTAFWDISAPNNRLWIDQLDKYAVEVFSGRVDSTALGAFPPEINHGFDRRSTGLPSTNPERMKAFFTGIADHLGTNESDISQMPPLADILASQLRDKPLDCKPGVGVRADGSIHWAYVDWYAIGGVIETVLKAVLRGTGVGVASDVPFVFTSASPIARYLYILRPDSVTPLVPPNLDLPSGTIWRLDQDRSHLPFISGLTHYGKIPTSATQVVPENQAAPEPLVIGQKYYLDAQIDMAFPAQRCIFTYPAKG